jgi:hypothetical protein
VSEHEFGGGGKAYLGRLRHDIVYRAVIFRAPLLRGRCCFAFGMAVDGLYSTSDSLSLTVATHCQSMRMVSTLVLRLFFFSIGKGRMHKKLQYCSTRKFAYPDYPFCTSTVTSYEYHCALQQHTSGGFLFDGSNSWSRVQCFSNGPSRD